MRKEMCLKGEEHFYVYCTWKSWRNLSNENNLTIYCVSGLLKLS